MAPVAPSGGTCCAEVVCQTQLVCRAHALSFPVFKGNFSLVHEPTDQRATQSRREAESKCEKRRKGKKRMSRKTI